MTTELTWTGSPDDMTAISGEYVLRIIKMKEPEPYWWWKFFLGDDEIETGDRDTAEEAKSAAINAMNEHLKKK